MIAGSVTLDINSVITSVVGVTVVLRVEPNKNAASLKENISFTPSITSRYEVEL